MPMRTVCETVPKLGHICIKDFFYAGKFYLNSKEIDGYRVTTVWNIQY